MSNISFDFQFEGDGSSHQEPTRLDDTVEPVDCPGGRPVNLLWTGGWDSTFRLLDLLFYHRAVVQPWHVVDSGRPSNEREAAAMVDIRSALMAAHPGLARQLRPLRTVEVESLVPDQHLTATASRLRLGTQYEWLSRFARQFGLDGLELCIERRPGRIQQLLDPVIREVETAGGRVNRLDIDKLEGGTRDLQMFVPFAFPVIHLTKKDMLGLARQRGWEEWLSLTWFCHTPKERKACGHCTPCMVALEEGMGGRIPLQRRIKPRLRLWKRKFEKLIRKVLGADTVLAM